MKVDLEKYKDILDFADILDNPKIDSETVDLVRYALSKKISRDFAETLEVQLGQLKEKIKDHILGEDIGFGYHGGDDVLDDLASSIIAGGRNTVERFFAGDKDLPNEIKVQESFSYMVPSPIDFPMSDKDYISRFNIATILLSKEHPKSLLNNKPLLDEFKSHYSNDFVNGLDFEVVAERMRREFEEAIQGDDELFSKFSKKMCSRDNLYGNLVHFVDNKIIDPDPEIKIKKIFFQVSEIAYTRYIQDKVKDKKREISYISEELENDGILDKVAELSKNKQAKNKRSGIKPR